jgi:hypothetical protein
MDLHTMSGYLFSSDTSHRRTLISRNSNKNKTTRNIWAWGESSFSPVLTDERFESEIRKKKKTVAVLSMPIAFNVGCI